MFWNTKLSHSTKIGNCNVHTESEGNNIKTRLVHTIKNTNGKIQCTWKLQVVHSHMHRYLLPITQILISQHPSLCCCTPGNSVGMVTAGSMSFFFFPISSHMSFLLASGSGKFRVIALVIWGKKKKRGFVWIYNNPTWGKSRSTTWTENKQTTTKTNKTNYNKQKNKPKSLIKKSYTCLYSSK